MAGVSGGLLPSSLLLLQLLAAATSPARGSGRLLAAAGRRATLAGKAIWLDQRLADREAERLLVLRTASGQTLHVATDNADQLSWLRSGDIIQVSGWWVPAADVAASSAATALAGQARLLGKPAGRGVFKAASIRRDGARPAHRPATGRSGLASAAAAAVAGAVRASAAKLPFSSNLLILSEFSTIFIPIAGITPAGNACVPTAAPVNISKPAVERVVFQEGNSRRATVASTFNLCSYGKTRLTRKNSLVSDLVQLPCKGSTHAIPWSFAACTFDDFNGWADAADAVLRARGFNMDRYAYRKLRPQLGSTGASQRAAAAALPPGHGGGGSKLGPKRRAAESRGCDRRPWAGNCGRSSAARGSGQIAKRAAAPNHASRPRRMPSGAPYRWAHPSNTEHAPGGEGGPGGPGQSVCPWIGLGYIGCDGTYECRSWVGGEHALVPQAHVHELGHNLYMAHSGRAGSQYDDNTCAMGYCCANRCLNTPHAWQMGWLQVQQLNGSTLAAGQTVTVTLASQAATSHRYRTAEGGDADLPSEVAGKVHVYTSWSASTRDAQPSNWEAALEGGQSWSSSAAGLVVRVRSISNDTGSAAAAVVSVCRRAGPETVASCLAGSDNDCNGLAGDLRGVSAYAGLYEVRGQPFTSYEHAKSGTCAVLLVIRYMISCICAIGRQHNCYHFHVMMHCYLTSHSSFLSS
ncbi:hypothetical protein CHLNCDRAFT_57838 [Chlorella variabilis]|uniref:Peptidase M11 gametolysin domain-containing protein n=1 Tax=Chlorella variabilis TaxID=554065 RepID=E1ZFE7_CHLVA|nr:hypothetical protein CHLNCDRAFT_57838 [Chlorella variabilis]EFN55656.1 hypothetical protein CHLNCDRAFT_57838 [Chlorella variabilis]|eukprot:XP_005847758.1 hypothetical protein CHLNCDRAFT_57838 [Chlorella variabilis]